MVGSVIIIIFNFFFNYFILLSNTSHITGHNSISHIWVGEDNKPWTDIGVPTHIRVCLEMNTHTGTLDYFISNKHIKDRVVNVPKDVYFGV
jgi:predicted membrane protein